MSVCVHVCMCEKEAQETLSVCVCVCAGDNYCIGILIPTHTLTHKKMCVYSILTASLMHSLAKHIVLSKYI